MSRKHFGTDGIRGVANRDLTPELAFRIGRASGDLIREQGLERRAILGRDTRQSGPMLGAAVAAGLCSAGIETVALGVAPTPAISFLARTGPYALGVVISASHNPAEDNGIKLIGHDGRKLPDAIEAEIEARFDAPVAPSPTGPEVGWLEADRSGLNAYLEFLEGLVPERLDGLHVAVDAAHGAAYELAPEVLRRLGAEVVLIGDRPDGMNINAECGATNPATIQRLTEQAGVAIGVAFDGDADRAVFSDEKGRLINGDRTIGLWSSHWRRNGRMTTPIAVGTVMSNGGFERFLHSQGIELRRVPVGDKHVSSELEACGAQIGGEQSGHIIFPELGPTGDGLATMLEVLRVLKRDGGTASSFYEEYEAWPQLLINVRVLDRTMWDQRPSVREAIARSESQLEGKGRLSVRASGTQPMLRIMVEAESATLRDRVAESLLETLIEELGGEIYSRVDLTHALGD